jgi:predicted dehydrogenase
LLRVAVIGAGSIGRRHIGNLLAMGCEVTVSDPDPASCERVQRDYPEATIARGFALDGPDAFVIASPHGTHLQYVTAAVAFQIPFFVEKPIGSLAQLEKWRALADLSADLTTQVGYQLRFTKALRDLHDEWAGRLHAGSFFCSTNIDQWHGKSYGPWLIEASHELDAALWMGAPANVVDSTYIGPDRCQFWLNRWLIDINARADHVSREWRVRTASGTSVQRGFPDKKEFDEINRLAYRDEMLHFIECVREGRQTDCPLSDGVRVLEVCQQVEEKARQAA